MAKKLPYNLHGWAFKQNREICFNQERLPITYHNFCHKSFTEISSTNVWSDSTANPWFVKDFNP